MALYLSPTLPTTQRTRPAALSLLTTLELPSQSLVSLLTALDRSPIPPAKPFLCFPQQQQRLIQQKSLTPCLTLTHSLKGDGARGEHKELSALSAVKEGCCSSAHQPTHARAQHAQHTPWAWLHPHLRHSRLGAGILLLPPPLSPPSGLSHPCQGHRVAARVLPSSSRSWLLCTTSC